MNNSLAANGISIDLSYVVFGLDDNGEPAWVGPVVLVQGGEVSVDRWMGAGLSQVELPDVDDATLAAIEKGIARELGNRDDVHFYTKPIEREEARVLFVAPVVLMEREAA